MTGNACLAWHFASHVRQNIGVTNARRRTSVALTQASAGNPELAGERGQTGDGATRLPAMLMLKHGTAAQHNHGRGLRGITVRKIAYALRLNTGNCGSPFWRVLLHMRGKFREAEG